MSALPDLVVHADWSLRPDKRRQCRATRDADGRYRLSLPGPVGALDGWLDELSAAGRGVFLGLDLPIGLPAAYAARLGIDDFIRLLPELGRGSWSSFYEVAAAPDEISPLRPFYPARPGAARQAHLTDALGVATIDDLRRACDRARPGRRAAAPIFWTMGAQQVGKAAISGWRDLLGPALASGQSVGVWPFDGSLEALLASRPLVVAESYPAEFCTHLGLRFLPGAGGKRDRAARAANAGPLLEWAAANDVALEPALATMIRDGFGGAAAGEDDFDAVVGVIGMLNVVLGKRAAGDLTDGLIRRVEGWILGQTAE